MLIIVEKSKINYILDLLMAVSFFVVTITGLVMFFFLPSGVRRGGYQEFLGITKQNWVDIHNWSGIILIMVVVIHLILHWNWIVGMTKMLVQKRGKK